MPPTYNSEFWRARAEEAQALANQMNESDAKDAMRKVAEGYERNRLRCAHDEAELAFNTARNELDDNIGLASPERLAVLWTAIDDKWARLQRTRQELEAHIQSHPPAKQVVPL